MSPAHKEFVQVYGALCTHDTLSPVPFPFLDFFDIGMVEILPKGGCLFAACLINAFNIRDAYSRSIHVYLNVRVDIDLGHLTEPFAEVFAFTQYMCKSFSDLVCQCTPHFVPVVI